MKKYAKAIVYGGLDGIITTFAVVTGTIGGKLSVAVIIILGFSNLLGDGFSMAAGDYLSSTTEEKHNHRDALKSGLATFGSFIVFGVIPLIGYLVVKDLPFALLITYLVVGFTLALLGYTKGKLTNQNVVSTIIQTITVGYIATTLAYVIAVVIEKLS